MLEYNPKNPELLKNLHATLNQQYDFLKQDYPSGQLKTFTDNVILAHPLPLDDEFVVGSLFLTFIDYQLNMVLKNYFLRGGIAWGEYYGDDDFAYGSALIEAHDLEAKKATYPRIILSPNMREIIVKHLSYYGNKMSSPQYTELLVDEDGSCFLNYLSSMEEHSSSKETYIRKIRTHKEIIETKLHQFQNEAALYEKYEWVAQYHNYYCNQFVEPTYGQDYHLTISGFNTRNFSRIVTDDRINI